MMFRLRTRSLLGPVLTRLKSSAAAAARESELDTRDSVVITEKGIQVDGRDLLHIETRNMCRCEACFGKHAHQRRDIPFIGNVFPGVKVEEIGRMSEHYLSVRWSDGHEGLIARTRRGDYGPDPINSRLEKWLDLVKRRNTAQVFWAGPDEQVTKSWDYTWVVQSGDNTREFLTHYMRYGIGFMSGIPDGLTMIDIVRDGLKMWPLRTTCYDLVDHVRYKPDPTNSGYGAGRLPLHGDLAYFYQTPHVQFFHCMENTVEGGDSFWADSFYAVREMAEKRPDLLKVLTTVPVTFRYTPPGTGIFQLTHHHVVNMLGNDIWQTVDHLWSMDTAGFTWSTDQGTREAWWEAFSYYRALVEDQSSWFVKRLQGGEFVITDNWRVFHARKEFEKTREEQERVVSTSYMDWQIMANRVLSPEKGTSLFLEIDEH